MSSSCVFCAIAAGQALVKVYPQAPETLGHDALDKIAERLRLRSVIG